MRGIIAFVILLLLPLSDVIAAPGALIDCASSPQSIATGGTDQVQLGKNNQTTTVWIENYCSAASQNIGAAESLWVNFGATAAIGTGVELAPCGSQVFQSDYPVTQALHVYGATTGHQFSCKANQ